MGTRGNEAAKHRVIVVDNRRLIREGIADLLSAYPDIEIVSVRSKLTVGVPAGAIVVGQTIATLPMTVRAVALADIADPPALLAAIRSASARGVRDSATGSDGAQALTDRERSVLRAVSEGDSAAEIGATLRISPRTVERHKQNARAKLGGPNQAVVVARRYVAQRQELLLEVEEATQPSAQ